MPDASANENASRGRNLIVCCDGTNNEFGPENTNVVRLVQVLDRNPVRQRIYYDPGVGTLPEPGAWGKLAKLASVVAGVAFGAGINWKVQEAYTYILNLWQPGDHIFLFGFSRGAYAVRVLAGMLHKIGLLSRGCENLVPYAMRLYKGVRDERKKGGKKEWNKLCDDFRWTFARPMYEGDNDRHCLVHFLGIWDTVSSVGWVWNPEAFPYTARNPSVGKIRHAVSLDERRWFFRQNLMKRWQSDQDLLEVWFPGVHCDVGGGYSAAFSNNPDLYSQLWRLPFDWIRREAETAGLLVDEKRLKKILESPAPPWESSWADPKHESLEKLWLLAEYCPKYVWNSDRQRREWHIGRGHSRKVPDEARIDKSVLQRLRKRDLNYVPPNLSYKFCEKVRALEELPDSLNYDSEERTD